MGANTRIEWADHTFNPWLGCTRLSPACDYCYAAAWAKRTGKPELWEGERRRTSPGNWMQLRKWNLAAEAAGVRARVFCASLADVFDNQVPSRWRDDLWHWITYTPHLDWLLLTKRPQNIERFLPDTRAGLPAWGDGWPNVWFGTTAENAEEYRRRWPHVAAVPAVVRFLSAEPLLGPLGDLDLGRVGAPDWIIAGGESGPYARPMHPDWPRDLRDQCEAAGVAFLFKQWGEWLPWEPDAGPYLIAQNGRIEDRHALLPADIDNDRSWDDGLWAVGEGLSHFAFQRVGKKTAGRLLDGREHNGLPTPLRRAA